jgi:hypothetical protein
MNFKISYIIPYQTNIGFNWAMHASSVVTRFARDKG